MKVFKYILTIFAICAVSACTLDNFDQPDGCLSGSIIDGGTGELVQTDVIGGTQISILEDGYTSTQYLRVKNDGTYKNSLLVQGKYTVIPGQRNFFQVDTQTVNIGKNTVLDFKVTPYIRIKNVSITKEYNTVIATFNLETTSSDAVKSVALYAFSEESVSESVYSCVKKVDVNSQVDESTQFKVKLNVAKNKAYFTEGKDYYFRVGATSSVSGAKANYATAVKLNIGEFVDEPEPDYLYIDHCESLEGYASGSKLSLDSVNPKEGQYSVRVDVNPNSVVILQKTFKDNPVDASSITKEKGYLTFDLYISDVSAINWDAGDTQFELTSGGTCDSQELNWKMRSNMRFNNGWNTVNLALADAGTNGTINMSNINFFRWYHTSIPSSLVVKIDNIRLYNNEED